MDKKSEYNQQTQHQHIFKRRFKKPMNQFQELTPWNGEDPTHQMKYFTANIQERFPKISNNTKNQHYQTKYLPKKTTEKFMLTLSKIQLGNHQTKQIPLGHSYKRIKQFNQQIEGQKSQDNHNFVLRNSFYSKLQHKIDNTKKLIKLQDLQGSEQEQIKKKIYYLNKSVEVRNKKQYERFGINNEEEVPIVITQSGFNKLIFKESKIPQKKLIDKKNSRYTNLNKSNLDSSGLSSNQPMMYPYIECDNDSESILAQSQKNQNKKHNRVNIARKHERMIQIKQIPGTDSKSNLLSPKKIYSQKSKISKFLDYYQKARTSFDQQPYYLTNFS